MPGKPTTRAMSDAHEKFIAEMTGGRVTPGSGNHFANQTDVRNSSTVPYALAADGKATFARSATVKLDDWDKLVEQAHDLIPILPLRFYSTWDLRNPKDFVVVTADLFADLLWAARNCESKHS